MNRTRYLTELDRALGFAANHTDTRGRMVVEGEIDTKDSGWLVLGAAIRGIECGWQTGAMDLREFCRRWTLASVRVDDVRSAWTTFALLLALELAGDGFRKLFSAGEMAEIAAFFRQIDLRFLLEASRNYRVAAAVIDLLRRRHGISDSAGANATECVRSMLDAYLGNGFFNDDDGRGDSRDRRIDAYSAEIIGLLLHYDEILHWNSPFHDRIFAILRDFCSSGLPLIDADGEFAKWGRSLRGEAEVKKIFLWEFARARKLTGFGGAAAERQFDFFLRTGIRADGKIGRDKAFDTGGRDEYTTHVQAQGYGIYGLAMALRFASGAEERRRPLPAETGDYVMTLPGPAIICANARRTGVHFILPAGNRLTKNMFFWHNRITGENDVEVDVSAKFMPIPYFGHRLPAPYSGPIIPFLPIMYPGDGSLLVPRNLDPAFSLDKNSVVRRFAYCKPGEYLARSAVDFLSRITCCPGKLEFTFDFSGDMPAGSELRIHLGDPAPGLKRQVRFSEAPVREFDTVLPPSVYSAETRAHVCCFAPCKKLHYQFSLEKT